MAVDVEEISAVIEESILRGELAAGSRINVDDHARRLGVSHIPVREALRALHGAGWVVYRPRQGAFVCERDPREHADLFEARLLVERDVVELAAQRRTAEQLTGLNAVLVRQAATEEPGELAAVNCEFHLALAACAHNGVLERISGELNKRTRFYYLPAASARRDTSLAEHRAILDAVRRRDSAQAGVLLCAHIGDTARLT
ncbi:GntR family transcriptional regulator [Pseudonocardiaceae bacterium YIM PH 21723]|nr:GntR family transcriptional regulator [Pseudonocardiaceae bacterium YIM PH 21723]